MTDNQSDEINLNSPAIQKLRFYMTLCVPFTSAGLFITNSVIADHSFIWSACIMPAIGIFIVFVTSIHADEDTFNCWLKIWSGGRIKIIFAMFSLLGLTMTIGLNKYILLAPKHKGIFGVFDLLGKWLIDYISYAFVTSFITVLLIPIYVSLKNTLETNSKK